MNRLLLVLCLWLTGLGGLKGRAWGGIFQGEETALHAYDVGEFVVGLNGTAPLESAASIAQRHSPKDAYDAWLPQDFHEQIRCPGWMPDGPNLYAYVRQNPWSKFDAEGLFLSALVTAGFAAYDTYQYATGNISGADYARRMALNGAALVADAASGGMGGGLAVRMAATGSRAVTTVIKTAKAVDRANDLVENVQTAVETGQSIVEASEGEGRGLVRAAANALEDAATKKVLGAAAKVKRTPSGRREGDFTRGQKNAAKRENATENQGQMTCVDCNKEVQNIGSEKGVPTPDNQAQIHHDPAIKDGGGRHSKPVVLCPPCHQQRHKDESKTE